MNDKEKIGKFEYRELTTKQKEYLLLYFICQHDYELHNKEAKWYRRQALYWLNKFYKEKRSA